MTEVKINIGKYINQAGDIFENNTIGSVNYYGSQHPQRKPHAAAAEDAEIVEEAKPHGEPQHDRTTDQRLADAIKQMVSEGTLKHGTQYWAVYKTLSTEYGYSSVRSEFQREAEERLHMQDIMSPKFDFANWRQADDDFEASFKTTAPKDWRGKSLDKSAERQQRKVAFRLMQLMGLYANDKEDWLARYTGIP